MIVLGLLPSLALIAWALIRVAVALERIAAATEGLSK